MKGENKYRNRVIGIIFLGAICWLFLGILSQIGIFSFGINFGFELILRRVFAVLGLTTLIFSVILSIIAIVAYRKYFPRWNKDFMVINEEYKKLDSYRKVVSWILLFWALVNIIVFLIPLYIFVITDRLLYDFELFETISAVVFIVGLIIAFIPVKKKSDQKKRRRKLDNKK